MDDLDEIRRRIARLEAELAEVKAQLESAKPAPAPQAPRIPAFLPPPQAQKPQPAVPERRSLLTFLRSQRDVPTNPAAAERTAAQRAWQNPRPQAAEPSAESPPAQPPADPPRGPAGPAPRRSGEIEATLLGSWFARIGILAIFLGAAFAFKYAVDRNLISPAGRVGIGLFVGLAFVAWGEWARRRTWPLFAQAVAGGGVAICYLSLWAGYQLYDLTSPVVTLLLLAGVVGAGGGLSLRHDSQALAVLAALGGFLNPLLVNTGRGSVAALNLYLLVLDAGILALAFHKSWRPLALVGLAATWLLAFAGLVAGEGSESLVSLGFAVAFFALFQSFLLRGPFTNRTAVPRDDLLATGLNSVALFTMGMSTLSGRAEPAFALVAGLAHIGLGAGWHRRNRADVLATTTFLALGIGAVTLAAGLQFEGSLLATVWAVEAGLILVTAVRGNLSALRVAGFGVFALSIGLSLLGNGLGAFYDPPRVIFSGESLPFVAQVAALGGAAALLRRKAVGSPERRAAEAAEVLGIVLLGIWLTFELAAFYDRADLPLRTLPFAAAAFWAAYSGAAARFGAAHRAGWARVLPAVIFGLSLATSVLAAGLGAAYEPERPVFSVESLAFLVQVAVLAGAAFALRRTPTGQPSNRVADGAAAGANVLALVWLTFELWAFYRRPEVAWSFATFTFTLSSAWTFYAAGLLAFGIALRARWARLGAVALFGLVIVKLVLADVWLLETPLRIAALMGLGFVLLLCSLGYHRFRALILGPDEPAGSAETAGA
ncbi:MAG TPA: DUF2339 domain-containing protein [Actinomycetota bacterium]|nr:DUF2339 domain-containing protein [Actinomycetota bacterium]